MKVKTFQDVPTPAPTPEGVAKVALDKAYAAVVRGHPFSAETLDSSLFERCVKRMGTKGFEFYRLTHKCAEFRAAINLLCL